VRCSRGIALLLLAFGAWPSVGSAAQAPILRYEALHHPIVATGGMVVSQRRLASAVGERILAQGGNAVDAAVATAFALAVVLPRAGNLGGGGFMLVHDAATGATEALDFRERAPAAAHREMFLDAAGEVDQQRYRYSLLATGVPGTVAGLEAAWRRHGYLGWSVLVQPAIELAEAGFAVSYDLASALATRSERLTANPHTRRLFYTEDGEAPQPGTVLRLPELARTLARVRDAGSAGFYTGRTADLIVAEMQRGGGLITHDDLAAYEVAMREPVRGRYMDHDIVSMPPPSSGGTHLVQMLNMLGLFPLKEYGPGSARTLHVLAEVMKRAYADRAAHMGDPDFSDVPVEWLVSTEYAKHLAAQIDLQHATPADQLRAGTPFLPESPDTTHLSVVDAAGNAVSLTTTLNFSFGNGIAVPGAGFLLNNELTDFSAKPGAPDGFGLLTSEANAVAPGKRPLSAMTPTIVLKDGRVALVTGSPGGSRIINAVLQNIVNVLTFGMNVASANHAPRIHHQWMPDVLHVEPGHSPDTLELLRAWGHPVQEGGTQGSVQSISYDGKKLYGAADPRRPDAGAVGVQP
jgi:gamma-glutamyltranspeptidase/glutathione hydrolase